jgi:hypothetical protein
MTKSKWLELVEWGVLAGIVLFMAGLFLTGIDQDADSSAVPRVYVGD